MNLPKAPRRAVYTCVFDGYDDLIPPTVKDPGVDYICFTDNPSQPANGWELRELDAVHIPQENGARVSRVAKIRPHLVLPTHDQSLYIDGNLALVGSTEPLFRALERAPAVFYRHPEGRSDVYAEAWACIEAGKDDPGTISAHVERYRRMGFSGRSLASADVIPTAMIIARRHSDPAVVATMDLWWDEFSHGSRRDQVSLPFALHRSGLPHLLLDGNSRDNEYVKWKRHRHSIETRPQVAQSAPVDDVFLASPASGENWLARFWRFATSSYKRKRSE